MHTQNRILDITLPGPEKQTAMAQCGVQKKLGHVTHVMAVLYCFK